MRRKDPRGKGLPVKRERERERERERGVKGNGYPRDRKTKVLFSIFLSPLFP